MAEYQSNVLEWPGQADEFQFPKSRNWHGGVEIDPKDQYLNPKSMADAGHNPPLVIVEECHKRGLAAFVSLRMNDTHDGQHPRGTLPNPEIFRLETSRTLGNDWVVRHDNRFYQVDKQSRNHAPAKSKVTVCEWEDGIMEIHYRGGS